MKVGDLVKLAKWCKNGPALMQIMETKHWGNCIAVYLEGPEQGKEVEVHTGNVFSIEAYDEAMKDWNERRQPC